MIKLKSFSLNDWKTQFKTIITDYPGFSVGDLNVKQGFERLEQLWLEIKDEAIVVFEYPYVDPLYRDSYYTYYSAKHRRYERDCIRIHFFNSSSVSDPADGSKSYFGFVVLRPTPHRLLGRSHISPELMKRRENAEICLSEVKVQVRGKIISSVGFPYSSQDSHTHTCAETCIWSVMEYFSQRYRDYIPVLPSKIRKVLESTYPRRSLPSEGLTSLQISRALKEFGFGSMIYSIGSSDNQKKVFYETIYTYAESGIPQILTVNNENISHAVVLIGHEVRSVDSINHANSEKLNLYNGQEVDIIDTASIPGKYIFQDDNHTPYQFAMIENPFEYYQSNSQFQGAHVVNTVVPLYPKIHLDAIRARTLAKAVLRDRRFGLEPIKDQGPFTFRLLLTSSKSWKGFWFPLKDKFGKLGKVFLELALPKFIWLAEIGFKEHYISNSDSVVGRILMDATGDESLRSVLAIQYTNSLFLLDDPSKPQRLEESFPPSVMYRNNLKGAWNAWKH
ncbi:MULTISPECIES: hypothetical protein [unclassified Leptospira]|uniref:hypothetical protein n=1 Tax=unclassified Leptospira TaxID=2633828 RepID=UPI0002BF25D8|nr:MULTISPECIES: hypothetical protein [unclassified Leptospira]EMK00263.1 hypothetical protein LEP1GSC192_2417 [Leptospira sp. B5-022]MCR1792994.1 hypothetical protein [Leptospira sp. id769339]